MRTVHAPKCPSELSHDQLVEALSTIQQILWFEDWNDPANDRWDPDKEWDSETIEWVSGVLSDLALAPTYEEESSAESSDEQG
jgi:hypothetical protein